MYVPRPLRRFAAAAVTTVVALTGVPMFAGPAAAAHTITTVEPAAAQTRTSPVVTIYGIGFLPGDQAELRRAGVVIAGSENAATSLPTRLVATFDLSTPQPASPGTYDVVVVRGSDTDVDEIPHEEAVCTGCFTVASPPPTVTKIERESATANFGRLRITGTNFAHQAAVKFYLPGSPVEDTTLSFTTATLSATQIVGSYASTATTAPGPRDVRVVNTDTASALCAGCLTQPKITGISPASRGAAAQDQTITISGQSFAPGSTVIIGSDKTQATGVTHVVKSVTPTAIVVEADFTDAVAAGAKDVTVIGPDGGFWKGAGAFTVTDEPTTTSVTPASRGRGSTSQVLTVAGTNFNGPTFAFEPATGLTIESSSATDATTATIVVTVAPTADLAGRTLRVTNADAGTSSRSNAFGVGEAPTVTAVSPSSRPRGFTGNVTISGAHFSAAGVAVSFGTGIQVNGTPQVVLDVPTDDYGDTIVAHITVAPTASGAMRGVEVTNLDDAGRSACAAPGCFGVDTALVSPAAASNTGPVTITLSGNTYGPGAVVQLVPDGRPAYQPAISATNVVLNENGTLSATFDLVKAAPLPYDVSVSGGANAASCTRCFTVVGGVPTFGSVSPESRGEGADDAVITVTGTNFANGTDVSFVRFSGEESVPDERITVVPGSVEVLSPTQLRFKVDVAENSATSGPSRIEITNTDGATGSCAPTGCFTINRAPGMPVPPDPIPAIGQGGSREVAYTLTDAEPGVTVSFGPGVTAGAATVTAGEAPVDDVVTVLATVAPTAATGSRDVTFVNPDGGRYVCSACFSVTQAPSVTAITPAKAARGGFVDVTVTGTNFASPALGAGPGVTVSNVASPSATSITARLTVAPGADLGSRAVTVTNGDGGVGSLADGFKVFTVPGAPTGVTATRGDTEASVTWTAPADDGGDALTGYTVTSSPGGVVVQATQTSATVTGLANGVSYTFSVVARNAAGSSGASDASNAVVPAGVPAAPTGVTGTPGNGKVDVSWTAPSGNGDPVTGYTVTASPGGATAQAAGTTATVDGLTNGTAYTFTVVATNGVGSSTPSAASGPLTPFTVPGAPTGVTATRGAGAAQVSWTAPAFDGGSPVTGYTVTSSPGGHTGTASGTTATVEGLTNGTAYTFTVVATNPAGDGPASAASDPVVPAAVPDAPAGVTATRGNGQASVSWTAPAGNGSEVTGYTVTSTPGGLTAAATGTTATVAGLTNGTSYTFSVVATNAVGDSLPSAASNAVVPATVPGAPTAVQATRGNGSAAVTWTAPESNGGEPVTGYTVTSTPGGFVAQSATNGATVEGLTNGTSYVFTVVASNAVGSGTVSDPSNPVVPAGVPGAPTAVTATAGNASAQVAWTAPAADGGSPVTGYTVTASPGGATKSATGTGVLFDGLANGTAYTFTVAAENAMGSGLASAPSTAVTPFTVPGAPTAVSAAPGDGQATVSWTAPSANGSPITGYTVTASPGGANTAVNGSTTMAVVSGLTNGTAYTFSVVATNAAGNGTAGSSSAVTPLTTAGQYVPVAPVRLLDTRTGVGRPGTAKVGSGESVALDVTGIGGVPANGVTSIAVNVTVTQPTSSGFLSVYPDGVARPNASNLNFVAGQTAPNLVIVKVGSGGRIRFFNSSGAAHVLADVVGYFGDATVSGASYTPLSPKRLMDTRSSSAISSGGTRTLDVTGIGGVPASGVSAVIMNVTVTRPTAGGFLTVHRAGLPRPGTSNLNFSAGQTVPNLVIAQVGPDGLVSFFNSNGATHVFADVVGYFGPGAAASTLTGLTPSRLLDTRSGPAVGPGQSYTLDVTGRGGVPASGVDAVVVNVTVTRPTATGFLTAYPSNVARPNASNLNFTPGLTVPNLVVVKVGPDGNIKLFNSNGSSHVLVDVVGYFS